MKRLTPRYRKWLLHRIRQVQRTTGGDANQRVQKRRRRLIVRAWSGEEVVQVRVREGARVPPEILCFDQNASATLRFLSEQRRRSAVERTSIPTERFKWIEPSRSRGRLGSITTYSDFSKINAISPAVALVITAEYDRLAKLIGEAPPTINLDRWSDVVFSRLWEIGFFDVVGLSQNVEERYRDDGNTRMLKIVSGTDAAGFEAVAGQLWELVKEVRPGQWQDGEAEVALNSALTEAITNVIHHAYPSGHEFGYRHVGRWWLTASVDRSSRTFTLLVYDQGATIPVTLPQKLLMQAVTDRLLAAVPGLRQEGEFSDDSAHIATAMRLGRSQTEENFRGYGIAQMVDAIEVCKGGRISILSRGGRCTKAYGKPLIRETYEHSVGGTLIEWVIELPEGRDAA